MEPAQCKLDRVRIKQQKTLQWLSEPSSWPSKKAKLKGAEML